MHRLSIEKRLFTIVCSSMVLWYVMYTIITIHSFNFFLIFLFFGKQLSGKKLKKFKFSSPFFSLFLLYGHTFSHALIRIIDHTHVHVLLRLVFYDSLKFT